MMKRAAALAAALCLSLAALTSAANAATYFPRYTGDSPSIAVALDALGEDSSYAVRAEIAAANGIGGYRGTAAQNIQMLELLRQGRLVRLDGDQSAPSGGLAAANLSRVSFLRQSRNTCKATSAAMAVNLILGGDRYKTGDMIYSGVLCRSLEGERYTGSDGNAYQVSYKTDGYVGSLRELEKAVDAALSDGLPIVVAVHSAASRHHWIVLVGRDGQGGYLAVDPARRGAGSMASQVKSMAAMGYSFGLADYARPHYGYISFQRR